VVRHCVTAPDPHLGPSRGGSDSRVTLLVAQAAVARSQSDTNIHCYKSVDFPLFHFHFILDTGNRFKVFLALQGSRIHFPPLTLYQKVILLEATRKHFFCSELCFCFATLLEKGSHPAWWDESHRDEAPQPQACKATGAWRCLSKEGGLAASASDIEDTDPFICRSC